MDDSKQPQHSEEESAVSPISLPQSKWKKFFKNQLLWIRIIVLLLTILFLSLSISYTIAQLLDAKLDLLTECEPKSREEIWRHSYESTFKYPADQTLNYESQYGITSDICLTTNRFEMNERQLWYSNKYKHEWKTHAVNAEFVLFLIMSIFCAFIILFSLTNIIIDIYYIHRDTLHKRSKFYRLYQNKKSSPKPSNIKQKRDQTEISSSSTSRSGKSWKKTMVKCMQSYNNMYFAYLAQDTTGWIVLKFMSEISELLVQSNALLIYNGYDIFDPYRKKTSLANKPQFIELFSGFIAFNAFGSGIIWMFYAIFPRKCYGLLFKRCLFFVDKFSDFLYIIFPFIMLYNDDYNAHANQGLVFLAQLHTHSGFSFFAIYFPMILLCCKCLWISISTTYRMRRQYFEEWKESNDIKNTDTPSTAPRVNRVDSDSFDNVPNTHTSNSDVQAQSTRDWDQSWIFKEHSKCNSNLKRFIIIILSLVLLTFGLVISIYPTKYIQDAKALCALVTEDTYESNNFSRDQLDLLQTHPELFLWDYCLYKVYPFTSKNSEEIACQCRVFVIEEWRNLKTDYEQRWNDLNITQQDMVHAALENWYSLEKFKSKGNEAPVYTTYNLQPELFNAPYMRAFEWSSARLRSMGSNRSESYWPLLEYLSIQKTYVLDTLPMDLFGLNRLKFLSLSDVGIATFPGGICKMKRLESLRIIGEQSIETIPRCVSRLQSLMIIVIDTCEVRDLPLGIFNMDNLVEFSLYDSFVDWEGVLEYNLADSVNTSNSAAVEMWFHDNFDFNQNTVFYLQRNPICSELNHAYKKINIASSFRKFLNATDDTCNFLYENVGFQFRSCRPLMIANGICDQEFCYAFCETYVFSNYIVCFHLYISY